MLTEVSFRSSKSSSKLGTDKDKVLLILEASKVTYSYKTYSLMITIIFKFAM